MAMRRSANLSNAEMERRAKIVRAKREAEQAAERQRREDARIMALHSAFSKLSVHIDDPLVSESDLEPEVRKQILAILSDVAVNGI